MSSDSPEEKNHRFVLAKGSNGWEDGGSLPRSPLVLDQRNYMAQRQRGASSFGLEPNSRTPKGPTLSNMPSSRSFSGRPATERGVSLAVGQHRSPYPSSSRFFITVVPPLDLPCDPPHPRSQASTSSGAHVRRGSLLPLYPTLGGQLYAISREYGLPSIGGLAIYLCDDGEGNLGPRVGDAAWSALWGRFFDENADDLYQDITSPVPLSRISPDYDRDHSRTSSDLRSPHGEAMGLRRESYEEGYPVEERRPSSSARRHFGNGYPASPMAYNTPSPRAAKYGGRSHSRSSFHTPVSTQARLPIVGRIEWTVDRHRAPWWGQWIGEAEASSEKSAGSISTSQPLGSSRRGPARRSMHLASSLNRSRADSPMQRVPFTAPIISSPQQPDERSASIVQKGVPQLDDDSLAGSDDQVGRASSDKESSVDMSAMGYEPIEDQETHEVATEADAGLPFVDSHPSLKINGAQGHLDDEDASGVNYEAQSYAGYSALLGVDDEARARDGLIGEEKASMRASLLTTLSSHHGKALESLDAMHQPQRKPHHFDANMLSETDEGFWQEVHEDAGERERESVHVHDRLSAQSLGVQDDKLVTPMMDRVGVSAVHDWISKTQSPRQGRLSPDYEQEAEEEQLLPPPDDVAEVVGLWAEKAREAGPVEEISSRRSSLAESVASSVAEQSEGALSRRGSPKSRPSVPSIFSPASREEALPSDDAPRLADLPEEAPAAKSQPTISKASLLSPIALDSSAGVFAGPSADLATLLGTRSTLAAPDAAAAAAASTGPSMRSASSVQHGDTAAGVPSLALRPHALDMISKGPIHRDSLSSPRLELPSPRSPGAFSQHSSSTDVSDTLLDMERALALLSPAVSNQNHGSPAVGNSSADTTYDSGVLTSAVRGRFAQVNSRESMAKAKTLSTSVTPSPRWFRNTTVALPHLPLSASASLNPSRNVSGGGDVTSLDDQVALKVSPRPASDSIGLKQSDRLAPWVLQPPPSASRLAETVFGRSTPEEREKEEEDVGSSKHNGDGEATPVIVERDFGADRNSRTSIASSALSNKQQSIYSDGHPSAVASAAAAAPNVEEHVHKESPSMDEEEHSLLDDDANDRSTDAEGEQETPVQIYDSPMEEDSSFHDQWLQPNEHLGRQGWSQTTGDDSHVEASRAGSEMLNELAEAPPSAPPLPPQTDQQGVPRGEMTVTATPFSAEHISSTFSPRSNQYATVGVQAEHNDHSRTQSIFSLVSDDASSSQYTQSNQEGNQQESDEEDSMEREEGGGLQEGDQETLLDRVPGGDLTPLVASVPRMGHSTHSSSDDVQPSIRRMIRGHSFAESSEASSSKAVSPFLPQYGEVDDADSASVDWSQMEIEAAQPERENNSYDRTVQGQGSIGGEQDANQHVQGSVLGDDATTARGGATNVASPLSTQDEQQEQRGAEEEEEDEEAWSQDGSEYDEEDGTGSPSTRRSRMSTYSAQMGANLSEAGGRTPTFFYDHHLADDEPDGQRASRRISSSNSRRMSKHRASQRLSRRSLRVSDAHLQDALGIYPSQPTTINAAAGAGDGSVGHTSVDAMSLAGEMLSSNDDRMLSGFEQVAHEEQQQQPQGDHAGLARARSSTVSTSSSNNSEKLKLLSEFAANANRREQAGPLITTTTSVSTSDVPDPAMPSFATYAKSVGAPIRRSMGSVSESRRESTGRGRRASASATSSAKNVVISSPSPRRSQPRMANDGTAFPVRVSVSPSPKARFRALPPSPSFLPLSPSSPNFGGLVGLGTGPILSPTSATFPARQMSNPASMTREGSAYSEHGLPSPIFRGQTGTPTPPSPRGPRPPTNLADYA